MIESVLTYHQLIYALEQEVRRAKEIIVSFQKRFEVEPETALSLSGQNVFLAVATQGLYQAALSEMQPLDNPHVEIAKQQMVREWRSTCKRNLRLSMEPGSSTTQNLMTQAKMQANALLLFELERCEYA